MKVKLEIHDSNVLEISGTSKADKPYQFFKQEGWVKLPSAPFPQKVELSHEKAAQALAKGDYHLDLSSALYIDRFSNLAIDMRKANITQAPKAATA